MTAQKTQIALERIDRPGEARLPCVPPAALDRCLKGPWIPTHIERITFGYSTCSNTFEANEDSNQVVIRLTYGFLELVQVR